MDAPIIAAGTDRELIAKYGITLRMARMFDFCEKMAAHFADGTQAIDWLVYLYVRDGEVKVRGRNYVLSANTDLTEEECEEREHDLYYSVNELHAIGRLTQWYVDAFSAREGWVWHTHEHRNGHVIPQPLADAKHP